MGAAVALGLAGAWMAGVDTGRAAVCELGGGGCALCTKVCSRIYMNEHRCVLTKSLAAVHPKGPRSSLDCWRHGKGLLQAEQLRVS